MRRNAIVGGIALQLLCNTLARAATQLNRHRRRSTKYPPPAHSSIVPPNNFCSVSFAKDTETMTFKVKKKKNATCQELSLYQNFKYYMEPFMDRQKELLVPLFWPVELRVSSTVILKGEAEVVTPKPEVIFTALVFFVYKSSWRLVRDDPHSVSFSFKELEVLTHDEIPLVNGGDIKLVIAFDDCHVTAYFNLQGPMTSQELHTAVLKKQNGLRPYKMELRRSAWNFSKRSREVDPTFWDRTVIPAMPYVAVNRDGDECTFQIVINPPDETQNWLDVLEEELAKLP